MALLEKTLAKTDGSGILTEKVMTGKPNPEIVNIIRNQHNIPKSELSKFIMLGDNPTTDIMLGNSAGIDTLLVLSGCVSN